MLTLVEAAVVGVILAAVPPPKPCPPDTPVISDDVCKSHMDAFVSCVQRTAAQSSQLDDTDKSRLQGKVDVEVRLIKGRVGVEGVRDAEKKITQSYTRAGHDGAAVQIVETCARFAGTTGGKERAPAGSSGGPRQARKKIAVAIQQPRTGEQLTLPYNEMRGTIRGSLSGRHLWVLAKDDLNYFLQYPPTEVSPAQRTWSQTNIRLGSSGKWKLLVCSADDQSSKWLEARGKQQDWSGFPTPPPGLEIIEQMEVQGPQ